LGGVVVPESQLVLAHANPPEGPGLLIADIGPAVLEGMVIPNEEIVLPPLVHVDVVRLVKVIE
jgi:hypothetical protein